MYRQICTGCGRESVIRVDTSERGEAQNKLSLSLSLSLSRGPLLCHFLKDDTGGPVEMWRFRGERRLPRLRAREYATVICRISTSKSWREVTRDRWGACAGCMMVCSQQSCISRELMESGWYSRWKKIRRLNASSGSGGNSVGGLVASWWARWNSGRSVLAV